MTRVISILMKNFSDAAGCVAMTAMWSVGWLVLFSHSHQYTFNKAKVNNILIHEQTKKQIMIINFKQMIINNPMNIANLLRSSDLQDHCTSLSPIRNLNLFLLITVILRILHAYNDRCV